MIKKRKPAFYNFCNIECAGPKRVLKLPLGFMRKKEAFLLFKQIKMAITIFEMKQRIGKLRTVDLFRPSL